MEALVELVEPSPGLVAAVVAGLVAAVTELLKARGLNTQWLIFVVPALGAVFYGLLALAWLPGLPLATSTWYGFWVGFVTAGGYGLVKSAFGT